MVKNIRFLNLELLDTKSNTLIKKAMQYFAAFEPFPLVEGILVIILNSEPAVVLPYCRGSLFSASNVISTLYNFIYPEWIRQLKVLTVQLLQQT